MRTADLHRPSRPQPTGELVGREPECRALAALVDACRGLAGPERTGTLLLSGDPGVGKTALVEDAVDMAVAQEMRVLRAIGVEFEAERSFAGLVQWLLPLRADIGALPVSSRAPLEALLREVDAEVEPRRVCTALLELLRVMSVARPVLLVVDDVQWLDSASAVSIAFVLRRLEGNRIGFLGARRSGSTSLLDSAGVPVRTVPPLEPGAASHLVERHFPTLADRVRRRLLGEARGNPLALLELPSVLSQPQRTATVPLPGVLPLNRRLENVFASRLGQLPGATRGLLLLAALDGSSALTTFARAAGAAGLAPLVAAERAGLVSVDDEGGTLDFRHPLVRSTVVQLATPEQREWAHRQLARALEDQPDRRDWHLAEATGQPDDELAASLERSVSVSLRRGDAAAAVAAMTRAAELSTTDAARSRRLAVAACLSADVTGEVRLASGLLDGALDVHPADAGSLATAAAAAHLRLNVDSDVDAAHRILVEALAGYGDEFDPGDETLVDALHSLIMICWLGQRAELWRPLQEAISRFRPAPPELLAACAATFGDPARRALAVLDRLDAAVLSTGGESDPVAITRLGLASVYVDRLGACRPALARVIENGRQGGAVGSAINAIVSTCVDQWQTGQWDEAGELAEEGYQLAKDRGLRRFSFLRSGYIQALVAAARGDARFALTAADAMSSWARAQRVGIATTFAHHVRGLVALGEQDFDAAYREFTGVSPAGSLPAYAPHALWTLFDLVEAAVKTGRDVEAGAHVRAMQEAGLVAISPRLVLVVTGSAALTASDDDEADALFAAALATPDAERWPFDLARVRLAYGEHLRRTRPGTEARSVLHDALDAFEHLGARPWARRASDELRAAGQTTSRTVDLRAVELTAMEREIALLAASGLANKEIGQRLYLSHRTVGAHLYRVFPKLGITSRAALGDALEMVASPAAS